MIEATNTVVPTPQEIKFTASDEVRFWAKVNKAGPTQPHMNSPCWVWTASKYKRGYGQFRLYSGINGMVKSHRLAWVLAHGQIPVNMYVCHRCDNPSCVNPTHLFIGTQTDNMRDMEAKKRSFHPSGIRHGSRTKPECVKRGDSHGRAKITTDRAILIRALYAEQRIPMKTLGAMFGLGKSSIFRLIRHKSWKHVL